ncbi:MAG: alpha/beta fold hydrolase [Chloroflexota bacterium]
MRLFHGILTFVLLVTTIVLAGALGWFVFSRQPTLVNEPARPDAPPYAIRGDYTVGVRQYTISDADGNRDLNAWVWYPATGAEGTPADGGEVNEDSLVRYIQFNGLFETSGYAGWNLPVFVDNAPYPLVVFSHGSGSSPLLSLFLVEHLASRGFVVIATEHPGNTMVDRLRSAEQYDQAVNDNYVFRPQDIPRAIDFALDDLNAVSGDLDGAIDPERIAVSGHSFGGYTAFAAAGAPLNFDALADWCDGDGQQRIGDLRSEAGLTDSNRDVLLADGVCYLLDDAERMADLNGLDSVPEGAWESFGDPRISAVIGFAPWNAPIFGEDSLAQITMPTLVIVGGNDNTTQPERDARNFYGWVSSENKMLVEFALGDHSLFVDSCAPLLINFGAFDACSDPVWDMTRAHDLTNHITTTFLRSVFYDDADATTALNEIDFAGITVERP